MAKVRPTSQAFLDKCEAESKKLRNKLAQDLNNSLLSVQHDPIASDVTVTAAMTPHYLHQCIIEARCPLFYKALMKAAAQEIREIAQSAFQDFQTIVKAIYRDINIVEVDKEIKRFISSLKDDFRNPDDVETVSFMIDVKDHSLNPETIGLQCTSQKHPHGEDKRSSDSIEENINKVSVSGIVPSGVNKIAVSKEDMSEKAEIHDDVALDCMGEIDLRKGAGEQLCGLMPGNDAIKSDLHSTESDVLCTDKSTERYVESVSMLGTDLLFMYQAGLHVDVVLVASGQQFYAHRCVLIARSEYFSAMLSGGWSESISREITLHGTRPEVLEQMLLVMYGGCLAEWRLELLVAADMYAIDGVRDCMMAALRRDKCHFFHKACAGCISGVSECLQVSHAFGLRDLYAQCVTWCVRYQDRVWTCRAFAQLPPEIHADCLKAVEDSLNKENFVGVALATDKILTHTKGFSWAEPVVALATQMIGSCAKRLAFALNKKSSFKYAASNLGDLLPSNEFIQQLVGQAVNLLPLHGVLAAYQRVAADVRLHQARLTDTDAEGMSEKSGLVYMQHVEKCLTDVIHRHISQLVGSEAWKELTAEQRKTLKAGAGYVTVGEEKVTVAKPSLSNKQGLSLTTMKSKTGRKKRAVQDVPAAIQRQNSQGARPKRREKSENIRSKRSQNSHGAMTTEAVTPKKTGLYVSSGQRRLGSGSDVSGATAWDSNHNPVMESTGSSRATHAHGTTNRKAANRASLSNEKGLQAFHKSEGAKNDLKSISASVVDERAGPELELYHESYDVELSCKEDGSPCDPGRLLIIEQSANQEGENGPEPIAFSDTFIRMLVVTFSVPNNRG